MRVLISGAMGFVGSALAFYLQRKGYEVVQLARHTVASNEPHIAWDPSRNQLNPNDLAGIDAVIHLAGESIAGKRWSEERKAAILNSRVKSTRLLANTMAKMDNPPKTFICASAIGYYGNAGNTKLTEVSNTGSGFLPHVCREWEAATEPAANAGIRVINTRFGMILHPEGGALKAMYWPFKLGIAGNLGNGKQYMSWISREDVVRGIEFCLCQTQLQGPINFTAPQPVTNAQFTRAMRNAISPAWLPMHYWTPPTPAWLVQAMLGQMGSEMLLSSTRVYPVRLKEAGFEFKFPDLNDTLQLML